MPLRSHRKRRERGGERRASPREAVWNHCFHGNGEQRRGHYQFRGIDCRSLVIFNLHRWIGRHACRGIDKATTFSELRLMSLSFGDSANYGLLANDSAWSHPSAYWSWASASFFGWGKETAICAFQEEYLLQPGRSWMESSIYDRIINRNQLGTMLPWAALQQQQSKQQINSSPTASSQTSAWPIEQADTSALCRALLICRFRFQHVQIYFSVKPHVHSRHAAGGLNCCCVLGCDSTEEKRKLDKNLSHVRVQLCSFREQKWLRNMCS